MCLICGIQRKQKDKSGHGNIVSHLKSNHPDIVNQQIDCTIIEAFVSIKASQDGWIL